MEAGVLSTHGGMRGLRLLVGLVLLLILLGVIEAWFLSTATNDPYGLVSAPAIGSADLGNVEALYAKSWTDAGVLAWSPSGRYVAVAESQVQIIDTYTGQITAEWTAPGYVESLAWSPDGATLAVGVDTVGAAYEGWVVLYDLKGVPRASWRAVSQDIEGLAWSPRGDRIVTAGAAEYAMWTNTGTLLYRNDSASTTGYTASWSPDGSRVAFGSAGGPLIIDAGTGFPIYTPAGGDWVGVAWSPRGDLIATGGGLGSIALYSPNGTRVAHVDGFGGGPFFGMPISWSPDGSMLVTLAAGGNDGPGGLAIVSAGNLTPLRTLRFPMGDVIPGAAPTPTYDHEVAWSPTGSAIAGVATTSTSSFRLWGVRHEALGLPLLAFGAATVLGLGLLLWREVLWLAINPERAGFLWAKTDPMLRAGAPLFLFALVSSILGSLSGNVLSRVYSLQTVPSATWYAFNSLLSVPSVLLAAVVAAVSFHGMTWRVESPRPFAERKLSLYGYLLLPFLLAVGVADVLDGILLVLVPTLDRATAGPLMWGILGAVLGLGFYWSGRVARGLPWVRSKVPWVALGASAIASIAALFGLLVLLILPLNVFQIRPPGGDFATYGFSIFLGFGFVPFVAAVIGLVTTAAVTSVPSLLRFAPGGYARVQGAAILELETRRKVMDQIVARPGIHFRALLKATGLGSGTLHYHLSVLEREGFLRFDRMGREKRFYPRTAPGVWGASEGVDER